MTFLQIYRCFVLVMTAANAWCMLAIKPFPVINAVALALLLIVWIGCEIQEARS